MSGETQEMTVDGKSVESELIWADNPELEYFRSIMRNGDNDKLASGDSLIGDSTVREMLEVADSSPLRRIGFRDTSGLSDTESNTVDNIYIEDGSLLPKKTTLGRAFDDGTIETPEDEDLVPPITRTQAGQNVDNDQQPNIQLGARQAECVFAPAQLNVPHGIHRGEKIVESKESASIPGFIFVTDGHPSIVHTKSADPQSDHKRKYNERMCLPRTLVVCMTLVVIVASTVVAVLVYRMKTESTEFISSSSQNQNGGTVFPSPNFQPTSQPSSLRANNGPKIPTSTAFPITDEFGSNVISDNFMPSMPPTVSIPNEAQTFNPTLSPTTTALNPPVDIVAMTESPTSQPNTLTGPPTFMPTPASSETFSTSETCVSKIETDEACYQNGDNIRILFDNCEPMSSDWIGVYPARQGVSNLNNPLAWVWTCGDQPCNNDSMVNGVATIYNVSRQGWYRAFLIRDDENSANRYSVYAISNTFSISSRGCD